MNYLRQLLTSALALPVIYLLGAANASALPKCGASPNLKKLPAGCSSPIVIDTDGKGFHLTSAENGVVFDIDGNGHPIQVAWTAPGSTNAFLALPQNGAITTGKELFGDFTPQPHSDHPNGFLALAKYDQPKNGGNGDGVIDRRDAIFSSLVLWIDSNHDGIAQPEEMHSLPDRGVFSISLHYTESRREDKFGNLFHYKSRINVTNQQEDDSQAGPVAYDVFFRTLDGAVR
jgi:hypothetical protein